MNKLLLLFLLFIPVFSFAQDEEVSNKEISMQELSKSLDAGLRALRTAESQGDKKAMGHAYGNLGFIYLNIGRHEPGDIQPTSLYTNDKKSNLAKSIEYSNKSADISDEIGDKEQLLSAYKNLRAAQNGAGKVKDAMATYTKIQAVKLKRSKELDRKKSEYDHQRREDSLRKAQQLAEERGREQQNQLSQQQKQLEATNQNLTAAQKEKENVSHELQKTQTDLSLEKTASEEKTKQLTVAEQAAALANANVQLEKDKVILAQNEIEKQTKALEQRRKEQYFYLAGVLLMLAFSLVIYRSFKVQKKFNQALVNEKKRSEELLLNILPAEVAEELMQKGFTDAKHFYDVTVLFTDFVNFTSVAETMLPQQLVGELHVCFKAFDMILSKYRIEKIKTVGDAYMAVSGLPISNPNHAADIAAAAIEIRDFMAKRKKEMGSSTFGIRIGINSGNVVAGIVGVRKFAYDIWGDTVNIAARMEQNSEEGKINISEATYELVKDKFSCEPRGKIQAKNKGGIDMYYLVEPSDHLAQASEILVAPPKKK